jgi:hypothetical protein
MEEQLPYSSKQHASGHCCSLGSHTPAIHRKRSTNRAPFSRKTGLGFGCFLASRYLDPRALELPGKATLEPSDGSHPRAPGLSSPVPVQGPVSLLRTPRRPDDHDTSSLAPNRSPDPPASFTRPRTSSAPTERTSQQPLKKELRNRSTRSV